MKIIFFKKKLFLTSTHQNNLKILKKLISNKFKKFKKKLKYKNKNK
jgi:hypothetical protein